jgi:hypothetical protein
VEGIVISALAKVRITFAATLAFATWLAAPAFAQQDGDAADQSDNDPPNRAARLSYLDGPVSLQPAGVQDWNAAPLNQPLTLGDALWSDRGSHAEIDLGSAVVRLDGGTSLTVLDFSDQAVQLRLDAGTLDISVSALDPGTVFEIDAPNAATALLRPGEYRLSVDNAGNTSVVIRNGQAQVVSNDAQNMNLLTGQRGLYGAGGYALAPTGPPDEFDLWCQQRQARWADEQTITQYVSSDVVGYEDLHDYGQWQQEPDDGYVWFPTQVALDWAPYSAGHWAWVGPWGWTWIDDAPWGFAPFHYGRWNHFGSRWGWVPAPPRRHAVYAPALVAWIGGPAAGAALSLGGGAAVGWLPLAPGEVYVPAYRVSARYLQNVNLSNSRALNPTLITSVARNPAIQDHYANRGIPRALTVMPQNNFVAGQPVARHVIEPPPQFQTAAPSARVPGIVPGRESVLGAVSLGRVARPPQAFTDRPVVTRREPPALSARFELQQPAIQANGGHPLDAAQLQQLRGAEAARTVGAGAMAARSPAALSRSTSSAASTASAPTAAVAAHRGIPERQPLSQPPAQSINPNVFAQRDHELQQQRAAQLHEQLGQELQQQEQRREQQLQSQLQQQQQRQSPPPRQSDVPRESVPASPANLHPAPAIKRPSQPLPPSEQR